MEKMSLLYHLELPPANSGILSMQEKINLLTLSKVFVANAWIYANKEQPMELLFSSMTTMVVKIKFGTSNLPEALFSIFYIVFTLSFVHHVFSKNNLFSVFVKVSESIVLQQ